MRGGLALAIGLIIYALAYAYVELLALRLGERNPFHEVATEAPEDGTVVVLGASRALPLEYQDMGVTVERHFGRPTQVLAMPGGGVVPNDLVLDHLLAKHGAESLGLVLYVLDSFAFYSADWNEARLEDARLWQRAPLDVHLLGALWRATRSHDVAAEVLINHASGFWKLNDPSTWYRPDTWEDEEAFEGTYEPSEAQDRARLDYLYPEAADADAFTRYRAAFARLIERLESHGVPFVAVKPPLRDAFRDGLPGEAQFDEQMSEVLGAHEVPLYDHGSLGYGPELFFDPDHLNRSGVERWLDEELVEIVERHARSADSPGSNE